MIDSLPNDSRSNVWQRPERLPVGPRYTGGRILFGRILCGGSCVTDIVRRIVWAVPMVAAIF